VIEGERCTCWTGRCKLHDEERKAVAYKFDYPDPDVVRDLLRALKLRDLANSPREGSGG
jgi:hypothetical protein